MHYMPTAKERTEALKVMMDGADFTKQATPGEQRKVYIELLATRMAVNSKRHKKDSLNVQMNAQTLAQGDGAKLVESCALAKQDKLEYYNPVAPAPAKNGPQNEAEGYDEDIHKRKPLELQRVEELEHGVCEQDHRQGNRDECRDRNAA